MYKNILIAILFYFITNPLYSQDEVKTPFVHVYAEGGLGLLTGLSGDLTNNYGLGYNLHLCIPLKFFNDKIILLPKYDYNLFVNHLDKSVKNKLSLNDLGIDISSDFYIIRKKNKFAISPFLGISSTTGKEVISPRRGYSGSDINTLEISGLTYDCGLRFRFNRISLIAGYNTTLATAKLSDQYKRNVLTDNKIDTKLYDIIIFEDFDVTLNKLQFTLIYSLPLNK
jgi:hypothetical protein